MKLAIRKGAFFLLKFIIVNIIISIKLIVKSAHKKWKIIENLFHKDINCIIIRKKYTIKCFCILILKIITKKII
ncbi:hypothetical protein B5F18_02490 [Lachnoclostridium sp. An181]|nr:hypothetical protein B5F18_02490 [Lachnoclostridium sp. An181]